MGKQKILIIPSWYPSIESKSAGIFFSKQAELLSSEYEVRILIGKEVQIGYKKLLKNPIDQFGIKYSVIDNYFLDLHTNIKLYQFEYKVLVKGSLENIYKKRKKAYVQFFEEKVLPEWRPDIIHAHDVFDGGIVSEAIKEKFSIPFVVTSHNPMNFEVWGREKVKLFFENLAIADEVIAVSTFDKRIILNATHSKVNPIVCGNYVDEKIFPLKLNSVTQEKSTTNLMYIGGGGSRKDFPTLIEAIENIKKDSPRLFKSIKCTLIIGEMGDGITISNIQSMINEKGLDDAILIRSGVSLSQLISLYSETDLYVSPSYYETFGVAVAEAMCCGLPVIAIDNGGVQDIIENKENGLIIPMKDPEIMAKAILDFMEGKIIFDPVLVRESIVNKFGSKAYLDKLNSVYSNILN